MRALAAALLLAACATAAPESDFSWLRGCWTSDNVTERWSSRPDGGAGADVAARNVLCGAREGVWRGECRLEIEPHPEGGWRYASRMRDDEQTYRLVESGPQSATFRKEWHPLRPPPDRYLTISVSGDRLRRVERVSGIERTVFEGTRCAS
jgi:hypothetical protein